MIGGSFALVTAIAAPGFSYLFTWPTLIAAMTLAWWPSAHTGRPLLRFTLVTGTTLIVLTPAIDTFLQLVQPRPGNPDSELFAIVAIPVLLGLLGAGLIRAVWPAPTAPHGVPG